MADYFFDKCVLVFLISFGYILFEELHIRFIYLWTYWMSNKATLVIFFPVGLQSKLSVSPTIDCLLLPQLFYRIFFSRPWWLTPAIQEIDRWKQETTSLRQVCSTVRPCSKYRTHCFLIGSRSQQDICYADSTVYPSELKCKVALYYRRPSSDSWVTVRPFIGRS